MFRCIGRRDDLGRAAGIMADQLGQFGKVDVVVTPAEAALDPGDLNCRNGKPPREPTKPGLFVDRAS